MSATSSRREFLGQGVPALGLLAWAVGQPTAVLAADDGAKAAPSTSDSARRLTERGDRFSAAASGRQGGLVDPARAGDHGPGRDGALRSGQVAPGEPVVTKALAYLEGFISPKGGLSEAPHANYSTSIALLAFREANANGRYDRTIKAGQEFLKTMQWDESEGKTARRRLLRRGGLRRLEQPARPVEHGVLHRSPARDRAYPPTIPTCKRRSSSSRAART